MGGQYRFMLTDLLTRRVLSDAVAFNVTSYARALNGAADCTGTLDLADPTLHRLTDPVGATEPRRTALWVIRDTALVWGGIIWTRRYSPANRNLEITASTPESYFTRRIIRETLRYTQVGQHDIIRHLINYAQATHHSNIGVQVPAGSLGGTPRDRTYLWHEVGKVWERISELCDVDGGPDATLTPDWTATGQPGWALNVGTPLGAVRNLELDFPGSVHDYNWPEDGGNSANSITAVGGTITDPSGTGGNDEPVIRQARVPAEWDVGIPLLEDTTSYSDVTRADTLAAHARADVQAAAGNRIVPELTIRLLDNDDLPQPGDAYRLRITDPYRFPPDPVTGGPGLVVPKVRVTSWTVNVSDAEGETVTLTVAGVS